MTPVVAMQPGQQTNMKSTTWLHGTLYVGVIAGRGLPKHKNMSIRHSAPNVIDACLGGLEMMACASRPSDAYCTVNIGPTRRFSPLAYPHDTPFLCGVRSIDNKTVLAERGRMC